MSRESKDGSPESEYEVEEICGKKLEGRKIWYLIKWVGYDEKSNTWEPEAHLNCPEKVQQYEQRLAGLAHVPPPLPRARPTTQSASQHRRKGTKAAQTTRNQSRPQAPLSGKTKTPPQRKKTSKKVAQKNQRAATETTILDEGRASEREERAVGSDSEQHAQLRRQIQETEALLAMQRMRRQGSGTTQSLCGEQNKQEGVGVKAETVAEGTSENVRVRGNSGVGEQNVELAAGSSGSSQSQNALSQDPETRAQESEPGGGGGKEDRGDERIRVEGASAEGSGRVKGRFSIDHSYPVHKTPLEVKGVARYKSQLYLLVQWVNEQQMTFVPAKHLNVQAPQLVIKYYESVLHFKD